VAKKNFIIWKWVTVIVNLSKKSTFVWWTPVFLFLITLLSTLFFAHNEIYGEATRATQEPLATAAVEKINLTAVGDVLMHMPVVNSTYDPKSKSYDFRSIFAYLQPELFSADIAVGVLETTLNCPDKAFTGYPSFNSPKEIAAGLQWAGIDLLFTAQNHTFDFGFPGIKSTLDALDELAMPSTGTWREPTQKRYYIMEAKGIKLAFISVTTFLNKPIPKDKKWACNLLYYEQIKTDILAARVEGADGIVVALHVGTEYERIPSKAQQEIADKLFELGVDIILGSHVHVIQPYELRQVVSPFTNEVRNCFVVHSLGNLISNQRWRYSDAGLLVNLEIEKIPGKQAINVVAVNHAPLWVDTFLEKGKRYYRVVKVVGSEVPPELQLDAKRKKRYGEVWQETAELFDKWNAGKQKE